MEQSNENIMYNYMKGERLITKLTLGAQKKLRKVTGNNTTKQILKEAIDSGVELTGTTKNKEEQAYQFYADIYNDRLREYRKRPKEPKKKIISIELITGDWEDIYKNYKTIKAITDTVNVTILKMDGTIFKDFNLENNKDKWQTFILSVQATSDKTIFQEVPFLSMSMTIAQKAKPSKKQNQSFKDGYLNCIMQPIIKFGEQKLKAAKTKASIDRYNRFKNNAIKLELLYHDVGVNQEALTNISNKLQIDIKVNLPFDNSLVSAKSTTKSLTSFSFINTRLNHVEHDEILNASNEIIVSQSKLNILRRKLDKKETYYTYQKNGQNISEIKTTDAKYCLDNEFNNVVKNFEEDTGINHVKLCHIKNKNVSEFIRSGVHFNETVDTGNRVDTEHIDMTKAYANFKLCKYYKGFLGKVTDFRKCNHIVEIGYYRIVNIKFNNSRLEKWNTFMNIYNNGVVYPSPELEFLQAEGVTFDIVEGCWGTDIDFNFNDELMDNKDENGTRFYCKYVGRMYSKNLQSSFYVKGSPEYISHLNNEIDCDNLQVFGNEARISYDREHNYHLSHICGYITSYMRMNVLEQLFEFEVNDIVKIVCDGIFYKPREIILKNCFRIEDKTITNNCASESYISNFIDDDYNKGIRLEMGEYREHNKIEVHLGGGGCGKTHQQIHDIGFINPAFFAPSWKLTRQKKNETEMPCDTIAKLLSKDKTSYELQKKHNNVLIIDEISMMTDEAKLMILSKFSECKIIFCGDIGYQLPPIFDEGVKKVAFKPDKMKKFYHNTNYRVTCPKLKELLDICRSNMSKGKPILNIIKETCKKGIISDYDYTKDMILATSHVKKNEYTELFKHLPKYYITKSDRVYGRGEITLEIPNTDNYECRHAYTVHSIQGETAYGNLFIDMDKMFENTMLYTAISRAKTLNQINLIY